MSEFIKNKWAYGLIWLAIIAIVVWIIAGTNKQDTANAVDVEHETYTVESVEQEAATLQSEETDSGHFIVKAENGLVRVYWVDESGEHLHRETTIAYDLLSVQDQQLLDEGFVLNTDEELARFLENFDS